MGRERSWVELGQQRYQTLRGQGLVLIDMDALERSIIAGDAGQAFHQMLNHYRSEGTFDGKGLALLQRAITGWILGAGTVEVPDEMAAPQPISLTSPGDVSLRRSLRVLAMVAELHKAGYQRLRVAAGMSPSGCYWRCHITPADNVGANGWEPRDWGGGIATYTSGDEDLYFGWKDAPGKSARQLAQLFLERFPELAKRGAGRDRPYAGWFVGMLGAAENGRLPIFFADWDLDPVEIEMPPPPIGAMVLRWDDGEDGFIANEKLRATDLPRPDASWEEIERFCITYDGYLGGQRSVDECMQIADRVLTMGLTNAAVDELRTLLFIRQRQARSNSEGAATSTTNCGARSMRTLSHRECGDCSAGLRRVRNKICPISNPGPDQKSSRLDESRLVGPSSLPRQDSFELIPSRSNNFQSVRGLLRRS